MFSLMKKVVGYFWEGTEKCTSNEESILNPEELDNLVSFLSCEDDGDGQCFKGSGLNNVTGRITYISDNYCLIDEHYYLDLRKFRSRANLEVGTTITFSVFRLSEDDEWQISKVLSLGEETWDKESEGEAVTLGEDEGTVMGLEDAEKTGLAQRRTLVAKVESRDGRNVVVDPGYVRFSLDHVETNIIPIIGDWLSLETVVELDEECGDLGGKVLKVERVSALRTCIVENGKVVGLEGPCAIVNGNILAHRLAWSPGYEPSVGDSVVLQAIESDCGAGCSWRALALTPTVPSIKKIISTGNTNSDSVEDALLQSDKEGIVITGSTNFGDMQFGGEEFRVLQVRNDGTETQWLLRARFHGSLAQSQMAVLQLDPNGGRRPLGNKPLPIDPGSCLSFEFCCKPKFLGSSTELFVFTFRGFRIERHLQVRVVDSQSNFNMGIGGSVGRDLYKAEGRDTRWARTRRPHQNEAVIVPGVRPQKAPAFVPMKLPIFDVPELLWDTVVNPGATSEHDRKPFTLLVDDVMKIVPALDPLTSDESTLSPKNYGARFHALLHLEEMEMSLRVMERDMFGVTLKTTGPGGQYLALEVPGLAEKRPSILVGDRVLLSTSMDIKHDLQYDLNTKYEGFIHRVLKSEVWLKFNETFHETCKQLERAASLDSKTPELKWDVSFHFSRTPLRRCHLAVDLALKNLGEQFLFPVQILKKKPKIYICESVGSDLKSTSSQRKELDHPRSEFGSGDGQVVTLSNSKNNSDRNSLNEPMLPVNSDCKIGHKVDKSEISNGCPLTLDANNSSSVSELVNGEEHNFKESPNVSIEEKSSPGNSGSKKSGSASSRSSGPRVPVSQRLFGAIHPVTPPSVAVGDKENVTSLVNGVNNEELAGCSVKLDFDNMGGGDNEIIIHDHQKRTLKWFNQKLNPHQKTAVMNILKGEARPLPYVIFGPPGTGKTVTLVEAILQTLQLFPESRIMVASPSNSSANLIGVRILESLPLNPGELVRLIALHCLEKGKIPSRLMPYCTTGIVGRSGTGENETPDLNDNEKKLRIPMSSAALGRHRITIGTCVTLGQIQALGFPQGHFTHIFIDEAGQATEPEALIPLGFLSTSAQIGWGQAVFAGDPRQLGPVVLSKLATHLGLKLSLLDRMLSTSPYTPDPTGFPNTTGHYNPTVVTQLVMNYRSVPELLSLTSELFYNSSLVPTVSPFSGREGVLLIRLAKNLPLMKCDPSLGNVEIASPLVFHGVRGEECRHVDSPSWYNPMEAIQCLEYIKILYHLGGIEPEDLGIITPYVEQVKTIRSLISEHCLPMPTVGTVEELQGQERLAIIMSSVRTSQANINADLIYTLGFVSSPNRLNVATSRARALLIVVGDPHLLSHDPIWNKLIRRTVQRGSYVGCNLPKVFLGQFDDEELKDPLDI